MAPLLGSVKVDSTKDSTVSQYDNTIVSLEREFEADSQLDELRKELYISKVDYSVINGKLEQMNKEKAEYKSKFEVLRKSIEMLKGTHRLQNESTSEKSLESRNKNDDGSASEDRTSIVTTNITSEHVSPDSFADTTFRLSFTEHESACLKSEGELKFMASDLRTSLTSIKCASERLLKNLELVKKERDYYSRKFDLLSKIIQSILTAEKLQGVARSSRT